MKIPQSKIGLALSTLYLLMSVHLIRSQGLFGESFIAIFLGLPWSLILNSFLMYSDFNFTILDLYPTIGYIWVLGPIILNLILLYWIGARIEKLFSKRRSIVKTKSHNK